MPILRTPSINNFEGLLILSEPRYIFSSWPVGPTFATTCYKGATGAFTHPWIFWKVVSAQKLKTSLDPQVAGTVHQNPNSRNIIIMIQPLKAILYQRKIPLKHLSCKPKNKKNTFSLLTKLLWLNQAINEVTNQLLQQLGTSFSPYNPSTDREWLMTLATSRHFLSLFALKIPGMVLQVNPRSTIAKHRFCRVKWQFFGLLHENCVVVKWPCFDCYMTTFDC